MNCGNHSSGLNAGRGTTSSGLYQDNSATNAPGWCLDRPVVMKPRTVMHAYTELGWPLATRRRSCDGAWPANQPAAIPK